MYRIFKAFRFISVLVKVYINSQTKKSPCLYDHNGGIDRGESTSDLRKEVLIKRSHKIRKTYASRLSAAGFPIDRIREYLGHSSLQTTLGYIYDPLSESERKDLLEAAFSPWHSNGTPKLPKIMGS